jgi:hypothetical protein
MREWLGRGEAATARPAGFRVCGRSIEAGVDSGSFHVGLDANCLSLDLLAERQSP